jgi:hypothetical protein
VNIFGVSATNTSNPENLKKIGRGVPIFDINCHTNLKGFIPPSTKIRNFGPIWMKFGEHVGICQREKRSVGVKDQKSIPYATDNNNNKKKNKNNPRGTVLIAILNG